MSHDNLVLQFAPLGRCAFRFTPEIVRAFIPLRRIGVYLLFYEQKAIYIGRSDTCLCTRLAYHPYLRRASHFTYEICKTSCRAFCLEAYWFHRLQRASPDRLLNCNHPGKPRAVTQSCPFCNPNDSKALNLVASKFGY